MPEPLLTRFLPPLLAGRRAECLALIREVLNRGCRAEELLVQVIWPALAQVERLYREEQISAVVENMAYRIHRTIADQLQPYLPVKPFNGRRLLLIGAGTHREEVCAQVLADLFQSEGWEVYLVGSDVPRDELLKAAGELRPACLLIYGTQPSEVPEVRALIEIIREMGACPAMSILVSGGVFERADGLWQEVGADGFAGTPAEVLRLALEVRPRAPGSPRPPGLVKKRHRRRKTPAFEAAAEGRKPLAVPV
jgi:methanogenic corrinoid protein MtbC1